MRIDRLALKVAGWSNQVYCVYMNSSFHVATYYWIHDLMIARTQNNLIQLHQSNSQFLFQFLDAHVQFILHLPNNINT